MSDNGNGVNPVFKYLQGRTTTLLWFLTGSGIILQWFHRLDGAFITFSGLILTVAMGHSWKEDWKELRLSSNGNGHTEETDATNQS
jgi:hypothetical protein